MFVIELHSADSTGRHLITRLCGRYGSRAEAEAAARALIDMAGGLGHQFDSFVVRDDHEDAAAYAETRPSRRAEGRPLLFVNHENATAGTKPPAAA